MTAAEFRATLPMFSDTIAWPDPDVNAALASSATYLSAAEWDTFYNEGVANWVADRLVTNKILSTVGPLGAASGTETMKQVGKVMVQRDVQIILRNMANPYMRTQFGQRYQYLIGLAFGGATLAV